MKIFAVDYGDSHTGIAASDVLEMLATPICIVHEKDFVACADKVAAVGCILSVSYADRVVCGIFSSKPNFF